MKLQTDIKNKFERNAKALTLKPSLGLDTGVSTIRIVNGLECEISEGDWQLKTDMPKQIGGHSSAPTPGVLGRAAFGSCLATGYMLWASKLDINIESLKIKVEADFDDGALFATSDAVPGYSEVRYEVEIESSLNESELETFLNEADKHSPYLDVFSNAISCKREVKLKTSTYAS